MLQKKARFRERRSGEQKRDYIMELMNSMVSRYLDKNYGVIDLANGNIDYSDASTVGYGMLQIIVDGKTGGTNHKPDAQHLFY